MVGTAKNGIEVLRILKDKPADVEDALDAESVHKVRYLRYACLSGKAGSFKKCSSRISGLRFLNFVPPLKL